MTCVEVNALDYVGVSFRTCTKQKHYFSSDGMSQYSEHFAQCVFLGQMICRFAFLVRGGINRISVCVSAIKASETVLSNSVPKF